MIQYAKPVPPKYRMLLLLISQEKGIQERTCRTSTEINEINEINDGRYDIEVYLFLAKTIF